MKVFVIFLLVIGISLLYSGMPETEARTVYPLTMILEDKTVKQHSFITDNGGVPVITIQKEQTASLPFKVNPLVSEPLSVTFSHHIETAMPDSRKATIPNMKIEFEPSNMVLKPHEPQILNVTTTTLNYTQLGEHKVTVTVQEPQGVPLLNTRFDVLVVNETRYENPNSNSKYPVPGGGIISDIYPVRKQFEMGINFENLRCNEGHVLIQKYDGSPACVTESTKQKLIERGWTGKNETKSKYTEISGVEKLLIEKEINYSPDKLVVTSGPTIRGDSGCGAVVDVNSKTHWFGIDSISNPREMTLYEENPNQCVVNTVSCFCNAQIELSALTLDELDYFTPQEQEKYANILIAYLYEENINRTPKFMIGKHNVNYTDPSAVGYCGKIWGTATYDHFSGAIVNGEVKDYGIDKELPLLCAISDNAPYFGKAYGE